MKRAKSTFEQVPYEGRIMDSVSETIQGDTLTMQQILIRSANGILLPPGKASFGDVEDDDHEEYDWMKLKDVDLVDKQELAAERIAFIEEVKHRQEEAKKVKSKNEAEATPE